MRTIIEQIQAGKPAVYNMAGAHLEILAAANPISVSIQDGNGVEITNGLANDIESGTFFKPPQGFARFVITSATTQMVKFGVSNGESGTRRTAGTVTIEGTAKVEVTNPDAQKRYERYGASFKSSAGAVANTPMMVFSAASNVRGAVIHRATKSGYITGAIIAGVLIAKATAPANETDGDVIMSTDCGATTSAGYWPSAKLDTPVVVPPGMGLYFISQYAETQAFRSVLYTLL